MQYIVYICDKRINTSYRLESPVNGLIYLGVESVAPELDGADVQDMYKFDAYNFGKSYNVVLVKTEKEARLAAAEFAEAFPDKQVLWGKLEGAFESVPSKPVEKIISEKGILPK